MLARNRALFKVQIAGVDEAKLRKKVSKISFEQFKQIWKKYEATQWSSSSEETMTVKNAACFAEDDIERAQIILDYMFNKVNWGRWFCNVIWEYIKNDILYFKMSENVLQEKTGAQNKLEYKK